MKKFKKFKKSFFVLVFCCTCLLVTGVTLAYLTDQDDAVENTFTPSEVTCEVYEPEWNNGNTTKENVSIKNTGDTDAYIRAAISVTWQNDDGEILGTIPKLGEDYSLQLNTDGSWDIDTTDGYYYHKSVVPALGDSAKEASETYTSKLINTCEVLKAAPEDGYALHVEVLASAIQNRPSSVVEEHWGVSVAQDGTISK